MKRKKLPLSLRIVQGAIGKKFVIKHYDYGIIRTRYPDMTQIIASARQRKCRDLFKEAVQYAREVIADPVKKATWQKRLRRRNGVYNEAIKEFMLAIKREKEAAAQKATRLIAAAFKNEIGDNQKMPAQIIKHPGPIIISYHNTTGPPS